MSGAIRDLVSKNCVPCKGAKPMTVEEAGLVLRDLLGWSLDNAAIMKEFRFKSYLAGLDFSYAMGKIAEEQDHHPDMIVRWRRVKLVFSTHSIGGLSQNDFIMAAKSELEYERFSSR